MIIFAILVNIRSFIVLNQLKQKRAEIIEDTEAINQSIENFVTSIEKENDELYRELVNYIKMKENKLDERIRILEEKQDKPVKSIPISVRKPVTQDDEQTIQKSSPSDEQDNEKISKLSKQGFSPKQIAKVLQKDHGEVELIINMLKKKKSYHN
ncbi:DUF6115 domain-containing protein [Paenisporosarcina indica]|uniref:DUF6115 domain-containing protein n=1 Tax=Paenisporosarcina indica TaxID=650093 RepID=UPI001FE9C0CF|nr:hypothetical protein [Paenisporosarcina indica]